jgi:hypothetical protein
MTLCMIDAMASETKPPLFDPKDSRPMSAKELQATLDRLEVSQRSAAKQMGISERNMRRYIAGDLPVPRLVALALRSAARKSSTQLLPVNPKNRPTHKL